MKNNVIIDIIDLNNAINVLSSLKGEEIEVRLVSDSSKVLTSGIVNDIKLEDDTLKIDFTSSPSIEIPQPIKLTQIGDKFTFDYTLKTLKADINNSNKAAATELIDTILEKEQQNIKKTKFFDTKINITKK